MKSPAQARDLPRVPAPVKALRAQIAEARQQSDSLAQAAQAAKADYKKARKTYKHARKLAKQARKELKRLCRTLKELSAPAAKQKRLSIVRKKPAREAVAKPPREALGPKHPLEPAGGVAPVVVSPV